MPSKKNESSQPLVGQAILPRKEPVQERSRTRFALILGVFRDLTIEKGVDAVSMKEVAEVASISIASLYQYFPDKAAIIATLADRYNRESEDCVAEIIANVQKASEIEIAVSGAYAIWQATQADVRLHQIDEGHCESVTAIIAKGFKVALPKLSKKESIRHGRLFTILIAAVVRKAVTLPPAEAKVLLSAYKAHHIHPSVSNLLA